MRTFSLRLLMIVLPLVLEGASAMAYDFEVDKIYYNITSVSELSVEVTYKE